MAELDLSIIIVNYNVKHFLEQCLRSVFSALEGLQGEVIVVDNQSTDGSQAMLKQKFGSQITLIENQDNPGFSKANNQGMRIAQGRYVLLLNPDTVVAEDTFLRCVEFMDAHPQGGALGIKMIDGQGSFLPESKRALPTPWVSFYKIFGFSSLFPRSRRFSRYHLSYLDREENHEIEILSGAFMFMRRSALEEVGLLDETFFMYGEDIDLSYRFIQAGYQNYYFSDSQIIHYKGESTKKGSLNYVKVFYQAMIIFAHKHFGGSKKRFFIAAIHLAVYIRAALAVMYRLAKRFGFLLIEGALIYLISLGITAYWEYYVKYLKSGVYEPLFRYGYLPTYALIFVGLLALLGAYRKPFRLRPLLVAPFLGFVTIATVTYMVSWVENYSRAIVGLTSVFTVLIAFAGRGLINLREKGNFFFHEETKRRVLLIGSPQGIERLIKLLKQELSYQVEVVGALLLNEGKSSVRGTEVLGTLDQLDLVSSAYDVEEVIFCQESMPTREILSIMAQPIRRELRFKIAPPEASFLVGSQEIIEPFLAQKTHYRLAEKGSKARKRAFDYVAATALLLTWPLLWWTYRRPFGALKGIAHIFRKRHHLVSYAAKAGDELPPLAPGLLDMRYRVSSPEQLAHLPSLDRYYAKNYRWDLDLEILIKGWRNLGINA